MYCINEITNEDEKAEITDSILHRLHDWFGIEESTTEYIEGSRKTKYYTAYDGEKPIGFISIKFNNEYTGEIYVFGILKEYHGMGLGTELVKEAEKYLKKENYKFLMVKTLGPSHPDLNYKKTRAFYRHAGFYPLDEIPEIWGKENPCLIMIKNVL